MRSFSCGMFIFLVEQESPFAGYNMSILSTESNDHYLITHIKAYSPKLRDLTETNQLQHYDNFRDISH